VKKAKQVRAGAANQGDIENFRKTKRVSRLGDLLVRLNRNLHQAGRRALYPEKLVEGMKKNDPAIAPSMLYAWASGHKRSSLRERSAKPDSGYSGNSELAPITMWRFRQGFQDWAQR